jgi:hypothetical protein
MVVTGATPAGNWFEGAISAARAWEQASAREYRCWYLEISYREVIADVLSTRDS